MWSKSNVGHEPSVQTCHNIFEEETHFGTLPLLVQFLLARKFGKSCSFKGNTIQHIGCGHVPQRGAMRVRTGVFDPQSSL